MLTEDGIILKDGKDIVGYLDEKMVQAQAERKSVTGIIISSNLRPELSRACQTIMGQTYKPDETVNRFRGALLIEDGENSDRIEVIKGHEVTLPEEGLPFTGFKRLQPGRRR